MNSGVTDTETIRPESREELILCRIYKLLEVHDHE